jgi:hypothetical protein
MDQETIQKIAAEVARHLSSSAWVLLLIQTVLLLLTAAAGAFLGEYLKTRGKNLATKADFESLKAQLAANTRLVETIKSEVGQKDWAKREWTNLRRTKLEALLAAVHDCENYIDRHRHACMDGKLLAERDPLGEPDTIATLYLPELEHEVGACLNAYREQIILASTCGQEVLQAGTNTGARQKAFDNLKAQWRPAYQKGLQASRALKDAARKSLLEIMGVE